MNSSLPVETDAFVSVVFFTFKAYEYALYLSSHIILFVESDGMCLCPGFSVNAGSAEQFLSVRVAVNYDYTTFSDSLNFETMVPSLFTVPTFGHTHQLSEHTQKCATYRYDCMIKFSGVTLHTPETSLPFHFLCCLNQKYII